MTQLDDVHAVFGELDDLTVARIVATGASKRDLVEASQRLAGDEIRLVPGAPCAVVQQLMGLVLEERLDREAEELSLA